MQRFMIGTNYKSGSQIFTTVGFSTFTVPPDVFLVNAYCWGGGAAGATANGQSWGGGGGGFGYRLAAVVPGTTYSVFVGAGGANNGAAGGTSYFNSVGVVAGHGGGAGTNFTGGHGVGSLVSNGANGGGITYAGGEEFCHGDPSYNANYFFAYGGNGGKAGSFSNNFGVGGNGGQGGNSFSGGCLQQYYGYYGSWAPDPAIGPAPDPTIGPDGINYNAASAQFPGGGGGGEAFPGQANVYNGGAGARGEVWLYW